MKKLVILLPLVVLIFAVGCKSKAVKYKDDPRSKIIGAEGVPRPEWMNGNLKSDEFYYVVGDGRMGMSKSAQQGTARTDALAKLAQWKSAVVADTMKNYIDESGVPGNTQTLIRFEQATIARSNTSLTGFDQVEYWIDQDGVYHGLYSYPKSDLKNAFQSTFSEFQRNEAAAFADYKSQEAFKYLEAQLDKK
ncbi:MAG: hypothetical protein FWG27_08915 [Treponema sp.]|nr:hypothetical protein [Treponema sp.]